MGKTNKEILGWFLAEKQNMQKKMKEYKNDGDNGNYNFSCVASRGGGQKGGRNSMT